MASNRNLLVGVIVALAIVAAYLIYERQTRSPLEKAGASLREAGRDVKDAVDPRTPGEKIRDGVKDTARDLKP